MMAAQEAFDDIPSCPQCDFVFYSVVLVRPSHLVVECCNCGRWFDLER